MAKRFALAGPSTVKPPLPADLPAPARAGEDGIADRSPFRAPPRFWTRTTLALGLVFASLAGLAALATSAAAGPDDLVLLLVCAGTSWLLLSARLAWAARPFAQALLEEAAADAIPPAAIDRVVMVELAGQVGGAGRRLAARIEHHKRAGRVYETVFWVRVLERCHAILCPPSMAADHARPGRDHEG